MKRKTFTVLFFIKKDKLLKNGEAPVRMRITVDRRIVDISVKRSCPPNLWNQAKECLRGKDRLSNMLNRYLEITRSKNSSNLPSIRNCRQEYYSRNYQKHILRY